MSTDQIDEIRTIFIATSAPEVQAAERARFDLALAEHDRQVAEQAWDEGFAAQGEQSFDAAGKPVGIITHNPHRADSAAPARPATDDREALEPVTATFGHGCITLTWYPSSQRVGVVQHGQNAVMDEWEFVEFARRMDALASRPTTPTPTVSEEQVGSALREHGPIGRSWYYHQQRPVPMEWVLDFLATLGVTVTTDGGEG